MSGYKVLTQLRNMDSFNGARVVVTSADISSDDVKKGLYA